LTEKRYTFKRTTKSTPCPICRRTSWCTIAEEGPVYCMGDPGGTVHGYRMGKTNPEGGTMWYPDGYSSEPEPAPKRKQRAQSDEKRKQGRAKKARAIWTAAAGAKTDGGANHPRVRAYIESRGIPIAALPGAAPPSSLRYHPLCDDTFDGETKHWTLSPAMVASVVTPAGKVEGIHRTYMSGEDDGRRGEDAKRMLGTCVGSAVRLSERYESGVLIITEGIETGIACLAACPGFAVWAVLSGAGLKGVALPPDIVAAGSADALHTVIIAGDCDIDRVKVDGKDVGLTGQQSAYKAADMLRKAHPWLYVEVRIPSAASCPELVHECVPEDQPIDGKSVDWLDVFAAHGREHVCTALVRGTDLKANQQRARNWTGETADVAPVQLEEGGFAQRQYLEDGPLDRARRFYLECESAPFGDRARTRVYLARFMESWWEYTGTCWCILKDEHLESRDRKSVV